MSKFCAFDTKDRMYENWYKVHWTFCFHFPPHTLCKAGIFNNRRHLQSSSLRAPETNARIEHILAKNNKPPFLLLLLFLISISASKCYFVIYNTFGNLVYWLYFIKNWTDLLLYSKKSAIWIHIKNKVWEMLGIGEKWYRTIF